MNRTDTGLDQTMRRHADDCRAQERQRQREAEMLRAGFELGKFAREVESMATFEQELDDLINRFSEESLSNTRNVVFAAYLRNCLTTWNQDRVRREQEWYGTEPAITDEACQAGKRPK